MIPGTSCAHRRNHHAQYLYTAQGPRRYPGPERDGSRGLTAGTCTGNNLLPPTSAILRSEEGRENNWRLPPKSRSRLGQKGHAACMCAVCHMRCVKRATAVRACTCVVTLFTLRDMRCKQRSRARAPAPRPRMRKSLFFGEGEGGGGGKRGMEGRQSYARRTTARPGSRSRPKRSKPAQRAKTLIQL